MRGHGVRGHKAPAKRVHTQKGAKPERGLTVENSENGMNLVNSLNGWDRYGDLMEQFIKKII